MINRKALWISGLLVLVMLAANIWRLSLLPDWHHVPAEGIADGPQIPVLLTFTPPLMVLFLMGVFFVRKWLRSGPEESLLPWRHYNGVKLLFGAGMMAVAQAFSMARSLGALQSVDRLAVGHAIMVAAGIFMIVAGNILPKMPWLATRFKPLDPWQWNQHQRFAGKVTVALGLFFALAMPLLPFPLVLPVAIGVAVVVIAAGLWHRAKVRRGSPVQG